MEPKMFCYQCQETAGCSGCTISGVCGKKPDVAAMQDLLVYVTKGLSAITTALRGEGREIPSYINHMVIRNLFTTITNANFDKDSIVAKISETLSAKEQLLSQLSDRKSLPAAALWHPESPADYESMGYVTNILSTKNEDIRSLRELITYGLKGLCAYTSHANALLREDPELTKVNIRTGKNPGILVSGHDLHDLEMLLEQTKGTGVDVYTHSEMLPAHYYPAFKKYPNFAGNYGNAWWKQKEEFESFNGPILMTTNCIVPPKDSYKDRIYTTGATGYPGCTHITPGPDGKKDFSQIISHAKRCAAPTEIEHGEIVGGFAHDQVIALADQIVDAVKSGAIRKFVVMAGCDGRAKSRSYYTDFAQALPKDTVILTAGCAKYRYNKLNLGDINGIPRVLDAGQCNDSYSLAVIAMKLQEVFGLEDINELPIIYNIAWYEQKAVIVLLALLSLGVKNIHLGPTLPAFLSPNVTKILVNNFGIAGISSVEEDMELFFGK